MTFYKNLYEEYMECIINKPFGIPIFIVMNIQDYKRYCKEKREACLELGTTYEKLNTIFDIPVVIAPIACYYFSYPIVIEEKR